jgi:hypothetical protein
MQVGRRLEGQDSKDCQTNQRCRTQLLPAREPNREKVSGTEARVPRKQTFSPDPVRLEGKLRPRLADAILDFLLPQQSEIRARNPAFVDISHPTRLLP